MAGSPGLVLGPPSPAPGSDLISTLAQEPKPIDHRSRFPRPARAEDHAVCFEIDPMDLPISLQHGLSPAMQATMLTTFWGTPEGQVATKSSAARALLGLWEGSGRTTKVGHPIADLPSTTRASRTGSKASLCPDQRSPPTTSPSGPPTAMPPNPTTTAKHLHRWQPDPTHRARIQLGRLSCMAPRAMHGSTATH